MMMYRFEGAERVCSLSSMLGGVECACNMSVKFCILSITIVCP